MSFEKKMNISIYLVIAWVLFFSLRQGIAQSIEFKGEVPLYEKKNRIVNKKVKKVRGFWKHWRATCITSRGAILRSHNRGFRNCMDNTGPDSNPRNNVKKSLDFMIEIKF